MTDMQDNDDELLTTARQLPRRIAPDRDLWAGIESRLGEQLPADEETPAGVVPLPGRPTSRPGSMRRQWHAPALAASLMLALAVGYWVGQSDSPTLLPVAGPVAGITEPAANDRYSSPVAAPVSLTEEVGLQEARLAMAAQIEAGLERLPADARFVVIENLTTINAALDEIDAVLAHAPASGLDRQLLISMYTDQLARLNSVQSLVLNSNQETLL